MRLTPLPVLLGAGEVWRDSHQLATAAVGWASRGTATAQKSARPVRAMLALGSPAGFLQLHVAPSAQQSVQPVLAGAQALPNRSLGQLSVTSSAGLVPRQ